MAHEWFLRQGQDVVGPVSARRLLDMARDGTLRPDDLLRRGDMEKWVPASRVQGLSFDGTAQPSRISDNPVPDSLAGQLSATTADGREVVLLPDGRWKFVNATSSPHISAGDGAPQVGQFALRKSSYKHFREIRWGMSEREVRDSEPAEPVGKVKNVLIYDGSIASLPCHIAYAFAGDKCVRGKYSFLTQHANDNQYLADFETLKDLLVQKYGRAISPFGSQGDQYWLNDLYADDYQNWGTAVGAGHLVLASKWETEDTTINLILSGDNFDISLAIEYVSKEFGTLEDQQQRQQNLADL